LTTFTEERQSRGAAHVELWEVNTMRKFTMGLWCVSAVVGASVAGKAEAIPVPDTGSACGNATECFTITNTTAAGIAIRATGINPQGYGVYAEGGGHGVYATSSQANAVGVHGVTYASGSTGVYGSASSGIGVRGYSGADSSYGVFGEAVGASARGVYGNATGATAPGVYGHSSQYVGVYGTTDSASSFGVYGSSTNGVAIKGVGYTRGVYGQATASTNGIAVTGFAPQNGRGVYGVISSPGPGYAVYGENTGTGAGAYAGYFWGNVHVTGALTQGNSDSRLKKNIQPLAGAIDQILRLHGVTYEWKDPNDRTGPGAHIGFIAQDVEKVFPHWVGVDDKGFRTLSTAELDGLVVESIRSLKAENDSLRERMNAMENRQVFASAGLNGNGLVGVGLVALAAAILVTRRRAPAPRT
jgi:hypothetical protein